MSIESRIAAAKELIRKREEIDQQLAELFGAAAPKASSNDTRDAARPNVTPREDVGPRYAALSTPENRVIGGVQFYARWRAQWD
ncbi:hypothetical protein IYW40_14460 [Methylocystis sp. H4A]|uniref:hypothetical protein n=1 Tax=Methylocystis sp. H4A TaxID=2785788 RepID=UPI0018C31D86|nr:hypothetical protein [Methylocystis sp. H4A]MBG0802668.1 hypothetical protein [Methylocystis sp. H4A]